VTDREKFRELRSQIQEAIRQHKAARKLAQREKAEQRKARRARLAEGK